MRRIDLKEWQDIKELPEFSEKPFLPVHALSDEIKPFIQISDVSASGLRIKATNYVGILPLNEDFTLTVSPKAPVEDFLYLLYRAHDRKVSLRELKDIVRIGRDKIRDYPNIFHFLLYVLLLELEKIRSTGILKKSANQIEKKAAIKGKILIKDTLVESWSRGDKSKVVYSYFDQSKDNVENKAIKFTLWMLLELYSEVLGKEIRDNFFEKYRWFEGVEFPKGMDFVNHVEEVIRYQKLPNSRNYYYDILNLCLFFITHSTLDYKSAKEVRVKAFVVDMNRLFEQYIYNVLKEETVSAIKVKRPYKRKALFKNRSAGEFWIEPDYLILRDGSVKAIGDAKYKEKPDNNDFYQLITYMERYKINKSILICPSWEHSIYSTENLVFEDKEIVIFRFDLSNTEQVEKRLATFIHSNF